MNLGAILLGKISETQKDKYYLVPLIWSVWKGQDQRQKNPKRQASPRLWDKMANGPILLGPSPFMSESLCPPPQMAWVSVAL